MQIVIELPDKTYKDIKEENGIYGINNGLSARITGKVVGAIQSGTPLPKCHGRLIDADLLKAKLIYESDIGAEIEAYGADDVIKRVFDNAPTIIEAGK